MNKQIATLLLKIEIAEHGLAMPRDEERVKELHKQLDIAKRRDAKMRQQRVAERQGKIRVWRSE